MIAKYHLPKIVIVDIGEAVDIPFLVVDGLLDAEPKLKSVIHLYLPE
jgi:hypothetical protein